MNPVITEEDFEALSPEQAEQWQGYVYKMAYEVVTPDSAEDGEAAERGWEEEGSERYDYLDDVLRAVEDHSWIEWSSSHPAARDWIVSEGQPDYADGSETSYSLWIQRADKVPLSVKELKHIDQAFRLRGLFT